VVYVGQNIEGRMNMDKKIIITNKAPAAIGPYSQAVKCGNLLITSGQIPLEPSSGEVVEGGIQVQTKQVLENLTAVLAEAGATLDNVIKTTCFLDDMNDFAEFNTVYQKFFTADAPARSCVAVDRLPKDVLVEIEAIALL